MLKVTRLESASLPYAVFMSKVLPHFQVNYIEESCETYNKRKIIDKSALHHMNLQHVPNGWIFKDENLDEEKVPTESSSASSRPKSEFEKTWSSIFTLFQLSVHLSLTKSTRI
ncbi:hypothetical protein LR48_Vigan46s002100 [Vigna angularis]|uniref:Uncharacterized protein n=1 Tax=Phaseolus angularis TaxID=3914 RepID=A0A0L9T4N5_PHAAN|nr:hypothetical protein LR48_Vigan46s002100 [Vigna angularis]